MNNPLISVSNSYNKEDKMQNNTELETLNDEVAVTLKAFLEGDNKALDRMLEVVDISRTDIPES